MANTTILQLPAATALSGAEWFEIVQSGTSRRAQVGNVGSSSFTPIRGLVSANTSLVAFGAYGVSTSAGAWTVTLPATVVQVNGDWIDIYDVDFNAAANNVTIQSAGGELIYLYGVGALTQTLNVSGARTRLVVNNGTWSMVV